MKMKFQTLFRTVLDFSKRAILTSLGSMIVAGISLIFSTNISLIIYSERLFWVGLIIILVGGIMVFSLFDIRRSFGLPLIIKKPEHAKALLEKSGDIGKEKDKRIDLSIRIWLTGMLVIGVSALIQILAEKLAG